MKVSELIVELEKYIEKCGDTAVVSYEAYKKNELAEPKMFITDECPSALTIR